MNRAATEVVVALLRVVGEGKVEVEVPEDILEDENGYLILSEHHELGPKGNSYVVTKIACSIDN